MEDYLPNKVTDMFFNLEKPMTGAQVEDPRWQRCLRKLESGMGMALGAILIREKFRDEDKKEVCKNEENAVFRNTCQPKKPDLISETAVKTFIDKR